MHMKRTLAAIITILMILNISGCKKEDDPKIAVVYFSQTGTTERVAEEIASRLDALKFTIVPETAYSEADIAYEDMNCRSRIEQSEKRRVEYIFSIENIEQYDYIFIGYPIWYSSAPRVVVSFLEDVKLSKKTRVIPFCTSGSSPITGSLPELKSLQPQCSWDEGKRFAPDFSLKEVDQWIDSLSIR